MHLGKGTMASNTGILYLSDGCHSETFKNADGPILLSAGDTLSTSIGVFNQLDIVLQAQISKFTY